MSRCAPGFRQMDWNHRDGGIHMFRLALLFSALLLAACGGRPPAGEISKQYEVTQLPGLLELKSFETEEARNIGSDQSPVWLARYTAQVATREDTWDIGDVVEGRRVLTPVHAAGDRFSLYGTVRSRPLGKGWSHQFQSDGSSNPVLGRPRTDYGPDTLLQGSPEAIELLARIEREREEQRIAEETARAEEAATLRRTEEAEARKRAKVEAAVARHSAAFAPRDVGSLRLRPGARQAILVTPDIGNTYRVWGTDAYTVGSDFDKSVVHAGLLKPGETGIVEVTVLPERPSSFRGSPRNGVDSQNYGTAYDAYSLRLLERVDGGATEGATP